MKTLQLFLLMFICFSGYAQNCDIDIDKVLEYKDEKVTICGIVAQIYTPKQTKGSPTYINIGEKYPNHSFTLVIWGDDIQKFEKGLEQFKGKYIAITGVIKEYKGKAQIVLNDPKQIKIIE